ncbi:MAG: hypothetical protein E7632_06220 [Ruminococcaceae bacterium]|nr:hypothetical protein [Oscillospiraceae bacterium]
MIGILLLILGIFMSGIYGFGLGPANRRCRTLAELELFNAGFTFVAMAGAMAVAISEGSMGMPPSALLVSVVWGTIFSLCVFLNLAALEHGPLSLTWLIVNFSLVFPLIYSFCFLGEPVTPPRVIGIGLLVICMLLFNNPKVTGEKKMSVKWLVLTLLAMFCNGALSIIQKIFAMATDNVYASSFLAYSYLVATIVSLILAAVMNRRETPEMRIAPRKYFTPVMLGLIVLVGGANFGMNYVVALLATMMDGSIVYPVIQGGGPVVSIIASRIFLGEKIPPRKAAAILLGIASIVLMNL